MANGPEIVVAQPESEARAALLADLAQGNYCVTLADDGNQAWEVLARSSAIDPFTAIILSDDLAGLSCLDLLAKIRQSNKLRLIPVIVLLKDAEQAIIQQYLKAGAFYYLAQPVQTDRLMAVLHAAVDDWLYYRIHQESLSISQQGLEMLQQAQFRFQTYEQCHELAVYLADACPEPDKAIIGLQELMMNALEHGNLGITYEQKSQLLAENRWLEEVQLRSRLTENQDKWVTVVFERQSADLSFHITDQGKGFDWQKYTQLEAERESHFHGRGIAMAGLLTFDTIEYQGSGNAVRACIKKSRP